MTSYFGVVEAAINIAASGTNAITELPAPGEGFEWRVLGFFVISSGAVNLTFQSGAGPTARSGPIPLAANTGVSPGMCTPGSGARWFSGGNNEAISVGLSAAVQVSGMIVAEKVPSGS